MQRIKALAKELAAKIAAGEVVERPLSIVKELVENSVDAEASVITVEIKKGGKEYIRVTDNGLGIEKDDLRLAFKRYATSKIENETDLENIMSLGFRGEALASIAAVSVTELISKPKDAKMGARIVFEAGEEIGLSDTAAEDGTTVIVKDLFYNLPARLKFMKSDNAESSLIADFLSKMALAYPHIKFRFINNGSVIFSTRGSGSIYEAIVTLYSPQTAKTLINCDYKENRYSLYGYISGPEGAKNNKRGQIFFVNGRWVKNKVLDDALEAAYHDKLFEGKHPVTYLFLQLPPSEIDVNVHPRKTEIKFYNESDVKDFVVRAIRKTLLGQSAAPDIYGLAEKKIEKQINELREEAAKIDPKSYETVDISAKTEEKAVVDRNIFLSINKDEELFSKLREEQQQLEIPTLKVSEEIRKTLGKERRFYFSNLKAIAQVFRTYIIATDENNLYMIDQHAAHERIMYEHLLAKFNGEETASQLLIAPLLIKTTPAQTADSPYWISFLKELGFEIEEFGTNRFLIKQIPASFKLEEAESFVNSVLERDVDSPSEFQEKRDAIIMASCKAAVKGGDKLSMEEIAVLFADLDKCENPFSCPHGRPTFLRLSEYDIERMFKRK